MTLVKRAVWLFFCLLLLIPAFSIQPGEAGAEKFQNDIPDISPVPQNVTETGKGFSLTPVVGVVTGETTDQEALNELKDVLKSADVKRIVVRDVKDSMPNTPVTIWLGSSASIPEVNGILEKLGAKETSKNEGYTVAAGHVDGHKTIVLSGADQSGTFYATQTFKQLIAEKDGRDWVPGVTINDWPTMPLRGSIEGFYGPPWSHEDRLNQIEFYGENKMNTYVYAPKDDPYHRDKWREPYPDEKMLEIRELVQRSKENHVNFVFALSPGNSVCFSDDRDFDYMMQKMQAVWEVGVRSFAVFLDDINPNIRCAKDKEMFGDDSNPPAAAQAYLLNRFNQEFVKTHEGANQLITVPTDYWQAGTTPYRERFADLVDRDIIVYWTGIGVVAPEITNEDAEKIWGIFDHDLLIWDNYPVNDYARNRLFLGPLVNRDAELTEHGVIGLTANPMNEAEASKLSLFTIADYVWNPTAYDPKSSWDLSIERFGGNAADALRVFAENNYSSPINSTNGLTIKPLIEMFWKDFESDAFEKSATELLAEFKRVQTAPDILREELANQNFLEETEPYLNKMELYGKAGELAVKLLEAQKGKDGEDVWKYRQQFDTTYKKAEAIPQLFGVDVFRPFFNEVIKRNDLWFQVSKTSPMTSMGTYSNYSLKNLIDGDPSTLYWSSSAAGVGDYVGVDLGGVYTIDSIELLMGSTDGPVARPDDYIHHGILEVSKDGSNWTPIVEKENETDISVEADLQARYVRYRAVESQTNWVQVREFNVKSNKPTMEVTGLPAPAEGSSVSNAADGDLASAYRAGSIPESDDGLTFQMSLAHDLKSIVVLQDQNQVTEGVIEIKNDQGQWLKVGTLSNAYSKVPVNKTTDQFRIVWNNEDTAPVVYEVIPEFN
ncbi:beta-N-acetylglucosaminidase domain-containing protein [Pseudalkalibacillus caeni]|nr:beta-N-acetylglucosaminidase domain-containing protein [Pseudalkalibacillus caeni]